MTERSTQYDGVAEDYARIRSAYYARYPNPSSEAMREVMRGRLSGKRVLDIGCGTGGDLPFLRDEGAEAYGIDPSEGMLAVARRDHPWAHLSAEPCERTAFTDGFFHATISKYALHYLPDPAAGFRELHRITAPGARVALVIQHPVAKMLGEDGAVYGDGRMTGSGLWQDRIPVRSPAHGLERYLCPDLLERFELLAFREGPSAEVRPEIPWRVPFFFALTLRRRGGRTLVRRLLAKAGLRNPRS